METLNIYYVIGEDDIKKYLTDDESQFLHNILSKVEQGRKKDNISSTHTCYISKKSKY